MYSGHNSGHHQRAYPANKLVPKECFTNKFYGLGWEKYKPTQQYRQFVKQSHNAKRRMFLKQELHQLTTDYLEEWQSG